jgi:hypothetical protein
MSKMSADKIRRKLEKLYALELAYLRAYYDCDVISLFEAAQRVGKKRAEWKEKLKRLEGQNDEM